MQKYTDVVTSARSGAAIPNARVTVKTSPGGVTATIYSDDGSTQKDNPITTDSNGEFVFYAADGEYTLTVSGTGITERTIGPILLHDPADDDDFAQAADVAFTQSGTGAVSEAVQTALRRLAHTAQYNTQGNYETARDALTGTFGMANLDVRGQLAVTGSSAGLVIDNDTDADFLDAITIGAGSSTLAKRYIKFRNLDDSTDWLMGANVTNAFIIFSDNDQRHPFQAAEVAAGGAVDINAGAPGTVRVNFETGSSNAGMTVYAGGSGTPARWVALDGQGVRIFIGGLRFGAAGGSSDLSLVRDAANVLALRNLDGATSGQTLNVYGTYTSAANYQRLAIKQAKSTLSAVSGATVTATSLIPDGAFLIGVTTRINTTLGATNGTTGYTVGDGVDADLWGVISAITAATASGSSGFTAAGACGLYTAAQSVVITATGGNFDGTGVIEVIAHYLTTEAD